MLSRYVISSRIHVVILASESRIRGKYRIDDEKRRVSVQLYGRLEKFDVNVEKLKLKDFKNDLTGVNIRVKDFEFFVSVCKRFDIKTLY